MKCPKCGSVVVNGWLLCSCGQKHRLIPAIDTPVYWCGEELLKLKEGDDVEVENTDNDLAGISETIKELGKPFGIPLRHWELFRETGRFPAS